MGKIDEYLDRAKNLAEEAGGMAKKAAGEVVDKAKELTDDGRTVRELAQKAKEQTTAITFGAKEKVQSVLQDAKAGKEIKQGIAELEALPEVEGSIVWQMELADMISSLKSLLAIVSDNRLDDDSVIEEIKKVMAKVQPSADPLEDGPVTYELDEKHQIEKAKTITYSACIRALEEIIN